MVGFRNIAVHNYQALDIVREIIRATLTTLPPLPGGLWGARCCA